MDNKLLLRVSRKEITLLTKIIESYDNMGVVSTLDPQQGLVVIHLTPDTEPVIRSILAELNFIEEIPVEKPERQEGRSSE